MPKTLHALITILVALLAGIAPFANVHAAPAPQTGSAQTLDLALDASAAGQDITLRGANVSQSFTFQLYPHWQIESGSELRLDLRYSPLLLPDLSSLSVSVGDTPIGATRLDPDSAGSLNVAFKLPAMSPTDGLLTIRLDAVLRTSAAACPDPNDPAAYLVLAKESRLHLAYSAQQRDLSLKDAPNLLALAGTLPNSKVVFVLPSQPQYADWQAASMVAARLGQIAGSNNLSFDVLDPNSSPTSALGDASVVYVGGADLAPRLQLAGLQVVENTGDGGTYALNGTPVDDANGILAIAPLPWSATGLAFVVTGGTDDALNTAARTMLDTSRLALLQADSASIPADTQLPVKPAQTPLADTPNATLQQLGREDKTAYGVGTHTITETVFVPPSWQIVGDGQLTLHYAYSQLVAQDQSTLTVLLNDKPVASVALASTSGQQSGLTQQVILPRANWQPGDNVLTFRFDLFSANAQNACANNDQSIWGTIYNSSDLSLRYGLDRSRRVDLGLYPYPFSGVGADQDPARLLLPDAPTTVEQAAALNIVAGLSRFVPQGESVPQIVPADRAEAAEYNYDVILLGGPDRNSISKQLNARLPVQWNGSTAQTLHTDWGVVFPTEGQGDLALVQEIVSPWNPNRLVLDIGYTRPGLVDRIAAAIGQQLFIGKFSGNVLVIDLNGGATPINTLAQPSPTPDAAPTSAASGSTQPPPSQRGSALLPVLGLVFAILILGIVLLLLRYIPKARAANESS